MKGKLAMRIIKSVFGAYISPCLTYACQTCTLTEKQIEKIKINQPKIERSMLGITLKNSKLNYYTGQILAD